MTGGPDREELISWGLVGLLDAVETYDPGKGAKFETYAISKIRWSILDQMRKEDPLPRRIRQRAGEVERAAARLSQELRRPPTEAEVAEEVGLGLDEYRRFLEGYSRAQVSSLEVRLETGNGLSGEEYGALVADEAAEDPQRSASRKELRAQLTEAVQGLGERERLVASLYFYEGLTLKEIGKAMNLTEGRISQILRGALLKLRERLDGSPALVGGWREDVRA
jgi:RNA polymerase sigma factor for flagellar operon FliA